MRVSNWICLMHGFLAGKASKFIWARTYFSLMLKSTLKFSQLTQCIVHKTHRLTQKCKKRFLKTTEKFHFKSCTPSDSNRGYSNSTDCNGWARQASGFSSKAGSKTSLCTLTQISGIKCYPLNWGNSSIGTWFLVMPTSSYSPIVATITWHVLSL